MKRAAGGFTLIEILAVSVVVLILAAIVLPMIGGMQKRGNGAKSIANMRQIGSGIAGYSGDNNGASPQSAGNPQGATSAERNGIGNQWDVQIMPYLGYSTSQGDYDGRRNKRPTIFWSPGTRHFYPEHPARSLSYGFNEEATSKKVAVVASAPSTILLAEINNFIGNNAYKPHTGLFTFGGRNNGIFVRAETIDYGRHGSSQTPILFADYSVRWCPRPASTNALPDGTKLRTD
jgi:prepilin-type N-terminal cleavage/methylation domain-containing protein